MSTDQPDYSPIATNASPSSNSPKPPRQRKSHNHVSKSSIFGIALISLLIAVALMYANMVIRQSQDDRSQAALSKSITLSLIGPSKVSKNEVFTVDVKIDDSSTQKVAAVDMTFLTNNNKLQIQKIEAGPFFTVTGNSHQPNQNSHTATILKKEGSRLALGAACDYCYLGNKPSASDFPEITKCTASDKCYPKAADGTKIATLTVKAAADGTSGLKFDQSKTQVAVMDGNNQPPSESALKSTNTLAITVGNTTEPGACETYNIAPVGNLDKKINGADIQQVANIWNSNSGDAKYKAEYDFFPVDSPDGKIQGADIQQVANHWNTDCN